MPYVLIGEDTYLGYMDNVSGNELMKIGFFTEKALLDTIPYTQQFEHKGIYLYFANEGVVFKDGKSFCFKELFNDTIFRVEPDRTLTPLYIADLGDMRPDPAARHRMTGSSGTDPGRLAPGFFKRALLMSSQPGVAKSQLQPEQQKADSETGGYAQPVV